MGIRPGHCRILFGKGHRRELFCLIDCFFLCFFFPRHSYCSHGFLKIIIIFHSSFLLYFLLPLIPPCPLPPAPALPPCNHHTGAPAHEFFLFFCPIPPATQTVWPEYRYAQWEKPVREKQIPYDSTHVESDEQRELASKSETDSKTHDHVLGWGFLKSC